MQEKKIKFTDVLFVGLAFFASYFGAGNLIFPPMLGLQSGSNWLSGMIGMLASGVGLPILAIIVLGMCGSVQKISDHVNKKFYTVMIGAIMILCCCVSIPRTAAVGIEMGLQGIWPGAPYLIFVILYFVIAFLFAKDRGTALDKVGKILTPIMTIILFILVVKGAVSPIGTPGAASVDNAFVNSFLGGLSGYCLWRPAVYGRLRQHRVHARQHQQRQPPAGDHPLQRRPDRDLRPVPVRGAGLPHHRHQPDHRCGRLL